MGNKYDEELRAAWEAHLAKTAEERQAALDQYRGRASFTQGQNANPTQAMMDSAPPGVVGRTYTAYPDLPSTAGLPAQYPKIPLPYGAAADPYAGQYPGPNPVAKSFVRAGTPASTMAHEQVHAETNSLARPMDRNAAWFNALSPADRVSFRAVKGNFDAANSHARFADMPGGEDMEPDFKKRLKNQIQEYEVSLREIDKRSKALGSTPARYAIIKKRLEAQRDLNIRTLNDMKKAPKR